VLDEDNTASMYRDPTGWTIHRKRAWTALLSRCHSDYIDFSITVGSERGTVASQRAIRTWMEHLSEFMSSFDFMHANLTPDWIASYPQHLTASSLSAGGRDYVTYLADSREVGDPAAGEAISGSVSLSLPPGSYEVRLYSPVTGQYSPAIEFKGGGKSALMLPAFKEDIVIHATRRGH
jgi:hypothetical protein